MLFSFLRRLAQRAKLSQRPKGWHWAMRAAQLLLSAGALLYIWLRLRNEPASMGDLLQELKGPRLWAFMLALALAPLNLLAEALKWRRMLRSLYPELGIALAYRAVLAGISTGLFTPNSAGSYVGRVLMLPSGRRWEAAVLTLLDRLSLMLVTLLAGWLALSRLGALPVAAALGLPAWTARSAELLLAAASLLGLLWLWRPQGLLWLAEKARHVLPPTWFARLELSLLQADAPRLRAVFALGALRYAVFTTQYVALLYAFGAAADPGQTYALAGAVLLLKSLIPSFALTELGIRETLAVVVMTAWGQPLHGVVAATFTLYAFNHLLPALAGVWALWRWRDKEG